MDDSYLSISFKVYPISGIEILIAELSLLEFELFEEKPCGLSLTLNHLNIRKIFLKK